MEGSCDRFFGELVRVVVLIFHHSAGRLFFDAGPVPGGVQSVGVGADDVAVGLLVYQVGEPVEGVPSTGSGQASVYSTVVPLGNVTVFRLPTLS